MPVLYDSLATHLCPIRGKLERLEFAVETGGHSEWVARQRSHRKRRFSLIREFKYSGIKFPSNPLTDTVILYSYCTGNQQREGVWRKYSID